MILFLGLMSWLLLGILFGWAASRFLPGRPALSVGGALLVGCLGALAGGLVASGLGFGGLATYDHRALLTAALAACLALTWWRIAKLTA